MTVERDMMVVGILGVGRLGSAVATRLAPLCPLMLCDIDQAAMVNACPSAEQATSLAELAAHCDVVIACLPSAQIAHATVMAMDWAADRRTRIFINLGSADPSLASEMNHLLNRGGIVMLSAPVSGSHAQARAGALSITASGPASSFSEIEPLLARIAAHIVYLGEDILLAQAAKLINNYLSLANLAFASGAAVAGCRAGIDPLTVISILDDGQGASSATAVRLPKHIATRTFDYGRPLGLALADLEAYRRLANEAGMPTSLSYASVDDAYRQAIADHGTEGDVSEVIRSIEDAAGVMVSIEVSQ